VEQGTSSRPKKQQGRARAARRPSLLVRFLIGVLVVLAVGGISFLIGYLIGLNLGVV
jgi:hypothetical protein